jgi:hypothetical protein
MNPTFRSHIDTLPSGLDRLLAMKPETVSSLSKQVPRRGIYLFSEGSRHLYVGRSNRLRQRVCNHGKPTATWRQAAFAFRLAREATGKTKASYRPEGSRQELMKDPVFLAAFQQAKARIAQMDVRYVEEADPIRQCLFEIYVAVTLGTPHNDFDNH